MIKLNRSQRDARDHVGTNLLILAGAGAGKTETIVARALNIAGTDGSSGLTLITFTKKAASTLRNRFEEAQGRSHHAFIGTFHSLCWRVILEFGYKLGIDASWAIMDEEDSVRLMKMCSSRVDAYECLKLLSFSRNSGVSISQLLDMPRFANMQRNKNALEEASEFYSRRMKLNKRLDFDSVLSIANELLTDFPDVRDVAQDRFKTILVDEYQDTNRLQSKFLENLNTGSNITVVGDDAQSVYSFRAARIQNIIEFQDKFDATSITLDTNYRCPGNILDMAEASLSKNEIRISRKINAAISGGSRPLLAEARDQAEEAQRVASEIKRLIEAGTPPAKICVLYRAKNLSLPLQQALERRDVGFVLPDQDDFFALPHIKSVMTVLRLATEPEDRIALASMYDLLTPNNLTELESLDEVADSRDISIWDVIEDTLEINSPVRDLVNGLANVRSNDVESGSVAESLGSVTKLLEKPLQMKSGGGSIWQQWLADLTILQTLAQPFSSVNDFLSTISIRNIDRDQDEDGVRFSSVHTAKGLEWDYVFVIGLVEFWFPSKLAIADLGNDEEERRLFYVASTRACKKLYLSTFKSNVNPYGKVMGAEVSRFITEVDKYIDRSRG